MILSVAISLIAVAACALIAYVAVVAGDLRYVFGVVIPGVAFAVFIVGIVYRVGSSAVQVRFYPYDRWAVPLDEMLAGMVATALDGSGGYHFSRTSGSRGLDPQLAGHLLWLEEIDTPAGPRVRYCLVLQLSAASGKVLLRRRMERESEAPASEVEDVVRRLQMVLMEDLKALQPTVDEALGQAGHRP